MARSLGWRLGSRSDYTLYPSARPLAFLDFDWKHPNWKRHCEVARKERPWLCAVPDLESAAQFDDVIASAEEIADYCERILVIPKAMGVIPQIPTEIKGCPVVLGYSVPTSYGGTTVPLWEFGRRPVHLLGGSPRPQKELCRYLNVVSLDGNMAWNLARRGVFYGVDGTSPRHNTLYLSDGERFAGDGPYEALRRSLHNLSLFWGETPLPPEAPLRRYEVACYGERHFVEADTPLAAVQRAVARSVLQRGFGKSEAGVLALFHFHAPQEVPLHRTPQGNPIYWVEAVVLGTWLDTYVAEDTLGPFSERSSNAT